MTASSALHVIVGAGPVGSATARLLADAGHRVRVVTRTGNGPAHTAIECVALDATDVAALTRATAGAAAIYNCANPPYHRWTTDWPPIANALLSAAQATGAVLVTTGNLYGYGPTAGPMTETTTLAAPGRKGKVRVKMWQDALSAHQAGRVRATEVRGSDFYGPNVLNSHMGERVVPRVLAGKAVQLFGDPDMLHSYTYVPDMARALVTAATDPLAWGQAWHAPTNDATTGRAMVAALCRAAGVTPVKVSSMPQLMLTLGGLFMPMVRELKETSYQFTQPFVLDSSAIQTTFGLTPTAPEEAANATIAWFRSRSVT
jgi:nucleoside-diphosphate-sugar epimerase